ncbi:Rap1a/Tai family immunity protein [Brucella intermedia]|uniref:Rap1a/Tai family immunity protein n=1 Tax=Brucella intermedia TaxID=94625 RepID=UPI00124E2490|nr:Rap1a/Tai family immunity protein [Brucella intermedia]KAB2719503.1 hypothetical protein F9L02_23425 [Brucella intermedia]
MDILLNARCGVLCLVFAIAGNAEARLLDGSDLQDACLRLPYMAKNYAIGTTQGLDEFMRDNKIKLYCAPSDLTGDQKTDIVCNYMKTTSNARRLTMNAAVGAAMAKAYPCEE